jgi:predicted N-acetyltransferase YhbS
MLRLTEIGPHQHAAQRAFCDYVRAVFDGPDFSRWCTWGEWDEDYRAYAVCEGERVVANASLMRMRLLVDGDPVEAFQIGAMGCRTEFRGRGLARRALEAALDACGAAPVMLFANDTVLDFYPRFGFERRTEHLFHASHPIVPRGKPATEIDPANASVRTEIHRLIRDGAPLTMRFGARGWGSIIDWYYANGYARPLRRLDNGALLSAGVEGDTLYIDAILSENRFDLAAFLPRLIDAPVAALRFGFTPELWFPAARPMAPDPEALLFVRGFARLPELPHKFPLLAQT